MRFHYFRNPFTLHSLRKCKEEAAYVRKNAPRILSDTENVFQTPRFFTNLSFEVVLGIAESLFTERLVNLFAKEEKEASESCACGCLEHRLDLLQRTIQKQIQRKKQWLIVYCDRSSDSPTAILFPLSWYREAFKCEFCNQPGTLCTTCFGFAFCAVHNHQSRNLEIHKRICALARKQRKAEQSGCKLHVQSSYDFGEIPKPGTEQTWSLVYEEVTFDRMLVKDWRWATRSVIRSQTVPLFFCDSKQSISEGTSTEDGLEWFSKICKGNAKSGGVWFYDCGNCVAKTWITLLSPLEACNSKSMKRTESKHLASLKTLVQRLWSGEVDDEELHPMEELFAKKCSVCKKVANLKRCTCLIPYYCSIECQKVDWSKHRNVHFCRTEKLD